MCSSAGCAIASLRVACCITDRANGIPANRFPAGRLALYWRKDGEPVWRDLALMADERAPGRLSAADAQAFILALASDWASIRSTRSPATKTPGITSGRSGACPSNVSPRDNKLDNEQDRARLAKIFEQGLDQVVGYALPLRREYYADGGNEWVSGAWFLRSEEMFLIPGDSPMGFRLPLDSIPWVKESEYPHLFEQDPMAERPPLARRAALSANRYIPGAPDARNPQEFVEQVMGPRLFPRRLRRETQSRRSGAGRGRIGALDYSHGALHGSSRRSPARIHAAATLP